MRQRTLLAVFALLVRSLDAHAQPPASERVPQYAWLEAHLPRYRDLSAKTWPGPLPDGKRVSPGDAYPCAMTLASILRDLGDLPPDAVIEDGRYDGALVEATKHFQVRHGLTPDGVAGRATLRALNVPYSDRLAEIEMSLAWLGGLRASRAEKLVVVNIPAFELFAWRGDDRGRKATLSMRVVVGRAATSATPVIEGEIAYVVFRPYWYVPRRIVIEEMLPAFATDPGYFEKRELELTTSNDDADVGKVVPTTPENVERLRAGKLGVRQKQGPRNSLGKVKFIFPNSESVYLHDTPEKSLFERDRRDFSHGCVRVHDPAALASFLLEGNPDWGRAAVEAAMDGGTTRVVPLNPPVPVWLLYVTAIANADGTLSFYEDVYKKGVPEGGPTEPETPR